MQFVVPGFRQNEIFSDVGLTTFTDSLLSIALANGGRFNAKKAASSGLKR